MTCAYTGQKLTFPQSSIDHVMPKSRGGKDEWENVVLAHKDINNQKTDHLPIGKWKFVKKEHIV